MADDELIETVENFLAGRLGTKSSEAFRNLMDSFELEAAASKLSQLAAQMGVELT